jgi:hypothetical protein
MFHGGRLKQTCAAASLMHQRRAGGLLTENTVAALLALIIVGGVAIITLALRDRQRMRELIIRERVAMIEKGLVPSPEMDPGRFDRLDQIERLMTLRHRVAPPAARRYRSLGVMMIGFGLAFTVLLTFAAGVPGVGLGIGGALMILGAAMVVNGVLLSHGQAPEHATPLNATPLSVPAQPQEPPDNIAP